MFQKTATRAQVSQSNQPAPDSQSSLPFFPAAQQLADILGIKDLVSEPNQKVAVPLTLIRALVSSALRAAPFDEREYIEANEDVKKAVASGKLTNAREHFVTEGYFQKRPVTLATFDPKYYWASNPDIAKKFSLADEAALRAHFVHTGRTEWRAPSAAASDLVRFWRAIAERGSKKASL